ncbi:MAG TPA: PAS domain-containing sensor histidine kinase [Pseudomonas sp.]|nr:PAS domain-containing sensor histidine kinase [Pseudomonas sp.]MBB50329.1 PAS domain-containing sensor histidine kinase [Pseudomonadales bacterium]HCA23545.1 PAS domain-containing sensor histidine kinase [Pseudomonas sp.]|tara:strand:- start:3139 stop:4575 length:1437 start_codon:yes stop_codon:yes gene_type:complete
MSDLLPTLHGLLQSDPLPMMLVDAGGQPMFRNGALLALASDTQGLAAWLPHNHAELVAAAAQQRRAIEDVHNRCGERHLLWSYIPLIETAQVWVRGRDATRWLQHQQEATVARRLYHLIIENTTDLISRHRPDGRFIDASPASWNMLGVWPEQLRGERLDSLFHPQEREVLQTRFRSALEQDGYLTYSYRIRHASGEYRWFETASRAIRETYTGEVVEVISVSRDITERLQSEEHNRRLQDELAHAARLATLGELASGIAHELNQPLAAILNYAGASQRYLAQMGGTEPEVERVGHGLARISEQAEHAASVIRRLRGFLRKGARRLQQVDAAALAHEAVGLCAWEASQHQVQIIEHADAGLPRLQVDPILLQQVLLNLLRNAIDANREEHPEQISQVQLHIQLVDEMVCIDVIDQGAGVSAEVREQLFVPFYTSKADGLGLGLSMSQGIVEGFGGSLNALPAESGGLCLRCLLPAVFN